MKLDENIDLKLVKELSGILVIGNYYTDMVEKMSNDNDNIVMLIIHLMKVNMTQL